MCIILQVIDQTTALNLSLLPMTSAGHLNWVRWCFSFVETGAHRVFLGQSKSVALYSPIPDDEQKALDTITGDQSTVTKSVTCTEEEQPIPSTTEYLETMTHSDSPPGLLPRYSSWSLCCIGRASDYIPNKGKNDTLQQIPAAKGKLQERVTSVTHSLCCKHDSIALAALDNQRVSCSFRPSATGICDRFELSDTMGHQSVQ